VDKRHQAIFRRCIFWRWRFFRPEDLHWVQLNQRFRAAGAGWFTGSSESAILLCRIFEAHLLEKRVTKPSGFTDDVNIVAFCETFGSPPTAGKSQHLPSLIPCPLALLKSPSPLRRSFLGRLLPADGIWCRSQQIIWLEQTLDWQWEHPEIYHPGKYPEAVYPGQCPVMRDNIYNTFLKSSPLPGIDKNG
jgi:hypothetical protein